MRRLSALILLLILTGCTSQEAPGARWTLWYDEPASEWEEALPIGNGRLGAMIFGGVQEEILQLNEDTVWAGSPLERNRKGAYEYLPRIRALLFEKKYSEADALVKSHILAERLIRSYQTLGNLILKFDHSGPISEYRRELEVDSAICRVSYSSGELNTPGPISQVHLRRYLQSGWFLRNRLASRFL